MRRYSVLLIPDPDEGGYTATVPTLPGCITEGDTMAEVMENVRDAIRLYVEDMETYGEPVPEERTTPQLTAVEV